MSEAKPFSKAEQDELARWAVSITQNSTGIHRRISITLARNLLRFFATIAQVEAERDEAKNNRKHAEYGIIGLADRIVVVMTQRDAYKRVVDALAVGIQPQDLGGLAVYYRKLSDEADEEFWWEYYGRVADALEALPKELAWPT